MSGDEARLVTLEEISLKLKFTSEKKFWFLLVAETQSGQFAEQKFDMTIYEDSNTPPKFAKQVDSVFKVILIIGVDGEIEDDSEVKYTSPIAIDEQEDRILMRFKGEKYFIKVKKNSNDSFFIKVNKRFLP